MTDPRLLVRLDLFPPVSGVPVAYMCTECGAAWTGEPTCSTYNPDASTVVSCLNLSPPDVVDGVPVRLDALGWACAVLESYGYRNAARALLGYDADVLHWSHVRDAVDIDGRCGRPVLDLTPGNGLHRPDAGRAVVAEALRKGRPGVTT
jgi:hypothetical protein